MPFDLTKGFNSVSELKKLDYDNDVNILMGGTGISNRMSLQAVIAHNHVSSGKMHEDFIEFILELSYQQIMEYLREVQKLISDAINRMNEIITQVDEQIAEVNQRLQNITQRHREMNDAIEAKYFDKDKDGTYKSKAIAETVEAYERRTEQKLPDDITPEMLILILRAQLDFEQSVTVPTLEDNLVRLDEFRQKVQRQKETLEEENKRIENALKAIDTDTSLSDEERRVKKAEILEQASAATLDAQIAAHTAEEEYVKIFTELREQRHVENYDTYIEHSNNETLNLNQTALDELQTIKPMLIP